MVSINQNIYNLSVSLHWVKMNDSTKKFNFRDNCQNVGRKGVHDSCPLSVVNIASLFSRTFLLFSFLEKNCENHLAPHPPSPTFFAPCCVWVVSNMSDSFSRERERGKEERRRERLFRFMATRPGASVCQIGPAGQSLPLKGAEILVWMRLRLCPQLREREKEREKERKRERGEREWERCTGKIFGNNSKKIKLK